MYNRDVYFKEEDNFIHPDFKCFTGCKSIELCDNQWHSLGGALDDEQTTFQQQQQKQNRRKRGNGRLH